MSRCHTDGQCLILAKLALHAKLEWEAKWRRRQNAIRKTRHTDVWRENDLNRDIAHCTAIQQQAATGVQRSQEKLATRPQEIETVGLCCPERVFLKKGSTGLTASLMPHLHIRDYEKVNIWLICPLIYLSYIFIDVRKDRGRF